MPPSDGRRKIITQRRTMIWELIRSGVSDVRSIAKALAQPPYNIIVSKTTVHADIQSTLEEYRKSRLGNVNAIVHTEVAQLDQYEQALALNIKKGDAKAVVAAVRVKERRARLLGLDAPDQWAHEAELRRMVTREQMLLYMRALSTAVLEAIEIYVADEDTRTRLRTTIANRFAVVSGGRSGTDDPAGHGIPLVLDARAQHSAPED